MFETIVALATAPLKSALSIVRLSGDDCFFIVNKIFSKDLTTYTKNSIIHGKIALENASKYFSLNEKEREMIKKHMWPVTIIPPRTKEGFLLTFIDKYCALMELVR